MSVQVWIPEFLRSHFGGIDTVEAEGSSVREVFANLERSHPGLADRLLDDSGLRRYVNVYVGPEDIRFVDGLDTTVAAGQVIRILPASSGGMFLP